MRSRRRWTSFGRETWRGRDEAARAAFAPTASSPALHGHQIGVTVNEDPRLVPYDHTPIEPGMVFSVEPGVYGGELGTGARCERVVIVREDGPEILSRVSLGDGGLVADLEARGSRRASAAYGRWTRRFRRRRRQVHALLGENGAGKSTFIKILTGAVVPDEGALTLFGKPLAPGSPRAAARAGVAAVFQELSLVPDLTVARISGSATSR